MFLFLASCASRLHGLKSLCAFISNVPPLGIWCAGRDESRESFYVLCHVLKGCEPRESLCLRRRPEPGLSFNCCPANFGSPLRLRRQNPNLRERERERESHGSGPAMVFFMFLWYGYGRPHDNSPDQNATASFENSATYTEASGKNEQLNKNAET